MQPTSARDQYLTNYARLETGDLDEAREAMGRMWERHRSVLKHGRKYYLRWHQADLEHASLSFGKTSNFLEIACGPVSDSFRITMHEAGRLYHRIDGRDAVSTATTAALHVPGQELHMETEPFSLFLLTLDGNFVRQALEHRLGRMPSVETWPRTISLTAPPGAALKALTRWTALELDRSGSELVNSEAARLHLQRTLLMLFLDCVAECYSVDKPKGDDLNESRVRLIEDWVDAHVCDPIGIEDLARVAGVSVRAVQTAFRRHRRCTPMQAVMRRRLEAAHKMLCGADPETRVTDVATQFGFFNFGRFSRRHREIFGETPSQIRARAAKESG
jgi:AraC-like DNA-binding protein